mmetsp:Transcript_140310/g.349784  ORF Transcript_140310/g.349784 Transcript_140310/m.349784 type:complete len:213 (-) Transcript_140310:512-1150(-)
MKASGRMTRIGSNKGTRANGRVSNGRSGSRSKAAAETSGQRIGNSGMTSSGMRGGNPRDRAVDSGSKLAGSGGRKRRQAMTGMTANGGEKARGKARAKAKWKRSLRRRSVILGKSLDQRLAFSLWKTCRRENGIIFCVMSHGDPSRASCQQPSLPRNVTASGKTCMMAQFGISRWDHTAQCLVKLRGWLSRAAVAPTSMVVWRWSLKSSRPG